MDWDLEGEVICGGGWGSKIVDAKVGVGGYAGKDIWRVWRKRGGVGAAMCGESDEGMRAMRRPDSYSAVPTAR